MVSTKVASRNCSYTYGNTKMRTQNHESSWSKINTSRTAMRPKRSQSMFSMYGQKQWDVHRNVGNDSFIFLKESGQLKWMEVKKILGKCTKTEDKRLPNVKFHWNSPRPLKALKNGPFNTLFLNISCFLDIDIHLNYLLTDTFTIWYHVPRLSSGLKSQCFQISHICWYFKTEKRMWKNWPNQYI